MKLKKTKLCMLAVCSALMLPAVAGAAAAADSAIPIPTVMTPSRLVSLIIETNVNGMYVPGNYVTNKDSRVAYIPGGVGLVVVDKATALPSGAYYVN